MITTILIYIIISGTILFISTVMYLKELRKLITQQNQEISRNKAYIDILEMEFERNVIIKI